jgi:2,3-bisphosphoglycerate-dependent phosphoglycerate mutase
MRVYLVRHAESKANAMNVHLGKEVELSDNGLKQAGAIAQRFVGVDIDVILCSRYKRAMQTARMIKKVVGKRIVYSNLLGEWRLPSQMRGVRYDSKSWSEMWDMLYENADNPKWHYLGAENVSGIMKRAKKLLGYVKSRKEESMIVVTHGAFIGVLLAVCLFGERITSRELRKTARFFRAVNTGITELDIDKEGHIRLLTFNDYAHLR